MARIPTLLATLAAALAQAPPVIDVFIAFDEVPMVRYRLRLHAMFRPIKTIVFESNHTHAGAPKPLHIRDALSEEEVARHSVRLVNVPFTAESLAYARSCTAAGKKKRCGLYLEIQQRQYMNHVLLAEAAAAPPGTLVFVSDVDELLDPTPLLAGRLRVPRCVSAFSRMYVYGERCAAQAPSWSRAVLFNTSSSYLPDALKASPNLQLRNLAKTKSVAGCPSTEEYVSWHLTYFMPTAKLLNKLRTFSHSGESFIRAITSPANGTAEAAVERRVRSCLDVHGRRYGPVWAAFDGVLPPLPGWPRHPLAPRQMSLSALRKEHATRAAAAAKAEAAHKPATAPDAHEGAASVHRQRSIEVARRRRELVKAEIERLQAAGAGA